MDHYDTHPFLYFTSDSDSLDTAIIEARLEPNARSRDGREADIVLARMPIGMHSTDIHRALDFALAAEPRYWVELPRSLDRRTIPEPDNGFVYRLSGLNSGIYPVRWGRTDRSGSAADFDPIRFLKNNGYL